MKKIAWILVLITILALCVGCSSHTLATPDGLTLEYNVLSWNRVDNASGYVVSVNDTEYSTHANFLELSLQNNIDYTIKVKAVGSGKYKDSEYSTPLEYKNKQNNELSRLPSPSISMIDGQGNIFWSLVGSSQGYRVFKNNVLHITINDKYTTSCALGITEPGTYSIQIQAVGDGVTYSDSAKSNVYKFVVDNSGNPEMPSLSAPTITYDAQNQTINWTKVTRAVGYYVYLNDVVVARIDSTESTDYSFKVSPNQTTNAYTVVALGDNVYFGMSKKSNSIIFPLVPSNPPENLRVEVIDGEPTITWDSVDHCIGYKVELNDKTETVLINSLKLNGYADGEYSVRVMATGDNLLYTSTSYSPQITVKVENGKIALPMLSAPDYPRFINNVLYWNATENAEKYQIIVETPYDDTVSTLTFTTTETSLAIDEMFEETVMIFYVKAIAEGFVSSPYSYGAGYIPPAEKRYIDDQGFEVVIKRDQYYFVQTPTDVVYDGDYLKWAECEYASEYVVTIDGINYLTSTNSFEYKIRGTSIVSVTALTEKDKYYTSPRSVETVIVCPKPLPTPEPELNKYTLSWSTVSGASGYLIYINGTPTAVSSTIIDLKTLITIDGDYLISVVAVSEGSNLYVNSLKSKEFLYTVDYGEFGTEEKPYLIESFEDFALLTEHTTAYFKVNVTEIDLNSAEIEPLFVDKSFNGSLDGNGVVIKNFKIKSKDGASGFFGLLGECRISNIVFENVIASNNSAIISSHASDVAIENVKSSGIVLLNSDSGITIGGLFGSFSGTAKDITAQVQILTQDNQTLSDSVLGGFSGVCNGTLTNITVLGSINVQSDNSYIGALAGELNATVNKLKIVDFNIKSGSGFVGLVSGTANSDITEATVSGSVDSAGGYSGAFGSFQGSFSGESVVSVKVVSDEKAYVGGFSGTTNNATVQGTTSSVLDIKAKTVYIGGFSGYVYGTISIGDIDDIDIKVDASVGYIGGLFGYFGGSYEKSIGGKIEYNLTESVNVNILIDSLIGNKNGKCLDSIVELTGSGVSRLFSIPQGSGTESDPYIVLNSEDTLYFEKYPNAYFILGADIDLENRGCFSSTEFSGVLDGKGKTIKSVFKNAEYSGLFARLNGATVSNLILQNVDCEGQIVGALSGYAENSTITGVTASGRVVATGLFAGGLIGKAENCVIDRCGFNGDIVSLCSDNPSIAGFVAYSSSTIQNSFAIVDITGLNSGLFSGFVVTNSGNITGSYAVGKSMVSSAEFSGFVFENSGEIQHCYQAFDAQKPFYAFVKIGTVSSCKYVKPTFVSVLNGEIEGLTAVDFDVAITDGIFADWDNSSGYSKITDLFGQTVQVEYSDLTIQAEDKLSLNLFEYMSFDNLSAFGVGKVRLPDGVTLSDGIFTFADYNNYTITVNYSGFSFELRFELKKSVNPDFPVGNGTELSPYVISDYNQFVKASAYSHDVYFVLDSDIVFADTIGEFRSIIDGNNRLITASKAMFDVFSGILSNANVSLEDNGIFAHELKGAKLKNITFNVDISLQGETVALIDQASDSSIESINLSGKIQGIATTFGGLVANLGSFSTITDVTLDLSISGQAECVGGLVGVSSGEISLIDGEISFINLTSDSVGGVVGETNYSLSNVNIRMSAKSSIVSIFGGVVAVSTTDLTDLTVTLDVEIVSSIFGGVVASGRTLSNCASSGTIKVTGNTSDLYVGGLVGEANDVAGEFQGSISASVSSDSAKIGLIGGSVLSATATANGTLSITSSADSVDGLIFAGGLGQGDLSSSTVNIEILSVELPSSYTIFIGGGSGYGKVENSNINISISTTINAKAYIGGAVGRSDYSISGNTLSGTVQIAVGSTCYFGTVAGSCDAEKESTLIAENQITTIVNGEDNANRVGYLVPTTSE